ncbi:tetratricopeptide repeat domain 1 [Calliopsis andreniformis]|uniref:tetratricopeptide repeat domain 1 n=1 Tax=Calliopsis andreniformis TaxID=337506 RepID=UPI003FCCD42A
MSDTSEGLKSNEEIIEELTKDLENSCIKIDEKCTSNDNNTQSSTESCNLSDDSCERVKESSDDDKCETQDAKNVNISADLVDEELLKDREVTLSESEKEELRNKAERLKNEGNELFKSEQYMEAISVYTQGIQTCPLAYDKERSILYANRAAAKSKCLQKESAIADCTKAIEINPSYVKAYIRRAQLHEEADELDQALEDYKKVLTFDPVHAEANYAVRRLPPLINEKNEKLKAEMLGKLKDLGNMVLKPFGLSTNNFELQKDPSSGNYSVKFRQNSS